MHDHRFFAGTPLAAGQRVTLPEEEGRHVARVLRLCPGDEIALFDGEGLEARARITATRRDSVEVEVIDVHPGLLPPAPRIQLVVPWMKQPARLDWLLEKAAELGVEEVVIFAAPRGREERWHRIAVAAAKQSGQSRLMRIVSNAATVPWHLAQFAPRILLSEKPGAPMLSELAKGAASVTLAVGPEEGFSDEDESRAAGEGWLRASLGPLRLRVETAAIAAVAGVRALG